MKGNGERYGCKIKLKRKETKDWGKRSLQILNENLTDERESDRKKTFKRETSQIKTESTETQERKFMNRGKEVINNSGRDLGHSVRMVSASKCFFFEGARWD